MDPSPILILTDLVTSKPSHWIVQNSAVGPLVLALAKVSGFRTVTRREDLLPELSGMAAGIWIERNLGERFQTACLNGATSMPLSFSALRSPRAMSTAPGVSP
jgi:hypothetical protein